MSAPVAPGIEYEGVVADMYKDSLFGGVKFWVHQRVPQRQRLVELIKEHGGKVPILEDRADVKIADYLRKQDAPPGSVSWKYIQDSILRGTLCNIEDYKIHRPPAPPARPRTTHAPGPAQRSTSGSVPRSMSGPAPQASSRPAVSPVGSRALSPVGLATAIPATARKLIRTPYTRQDDALLIRWINHCEKSGLVGDKIYRELEEKHPQHSWQSWKNRWFKTLRNYPRDELRAILHSTPSVPGAKSNTIQVPTPSAQPSPQATPQPSCASANAPPTARLSPHITSGSRAKLTKTKFTPEDDQILRRAVKNAVFNGVGKDRGTKIFQELAEKHPHHTFHSWRSRWVGFLQRLPDTTNAVSAPTENSNEEDPDEEGPDEEDPDEEDPDEAHAHHPAVPPKVSSANYTVPPRNRSRQVQLERHSDTRTMGHGQTPHSEEPTRQNLQTFHASSALPQPPGAAQVSISAARLTTASGEQANELESEVDDLAHMNEAKITQPRQLFYMQLYYFAESNSVPVPPGTVVIGGRSVELWDLWNAATTQKTPVDTRNWESVADTLGFDCKNDPRVAGLLKEKFDQHLGDFDQVQQAFAQAGPSADEGTDQNVSEDDQEKHMADDVVCDEFLSSPPIVGTKRRFDESALSSVIGLSSPSKRRRYDLDDSEEIPYTPEKVGRDQGHISNSVAIPIYWQQSEPSQQLPRLPGAVRIVEPETQDFAYHMQPFDEDEGDSLDPTPSQQLRSEDQFLESTPRAPPLRPDEQPVFNSSTSHRPSAMQRTPASAPTEISDDSFPSISRLVGKPREPMPKPPQPSESDDESEAFATPVKPLPHHINAAATRPVAVPSPPRRTLPANWSKEPLSPPAPVQRRTAPQSGATRPLSAPMPSAAQPRKVPFSSAPPASSGLDEEKSLAAVDATIEEYEALGYERKIVCKALRATTLLRASAGLVMESLMRGEGIPEDVPGVWTKREDQWMKIMFIDKGAKAKLTSQERSDLEMAINRIFQKHGKERCNRRKEYLLLGK